MSLIVLDDVCPLCGKPFGEGETAYAAWARFTARDADLSALSVRSLHWDCYLGWDRQAEFAAAATASWRLFVGHSPFLHRVLDRPEVLVCLDIRHRGSEEVSLFLIGLGYDLRVAVEDWDEFLKFPTTAFGLHRSVAAVWTGVRDAVRATLPSATMIRGNYPPLPEGHGGDFEPVSDPAVFSVTVKQDRWRELLALQRDGLEKSYCRRLIEFVSYYPDDEPAAERLRDERPWIDRYLFERRELTALKESGLLWVLTGGWPRPTDAAVRAAAAEYCRQVLERFPDSRAAQHARRLMARWKLDNP